METATDLVVREDGEVRQGGVIRLADKLDNIVSGFEDYVKACNALLTADDFQKIGPKQFKKKSAWRKIATAFGISTKIVSKDVAYGDDGRIHHAEFVVRAEAPNGRTAEAWAGASTTDRKFSHDQDIAATAQTRATNRAIADLIGCGEVSADEAGDGEPSRNGGPPPEEPPAYSQDFIARSQEYVRAWKIALPGCNSKEDFGRINSEMKAEKQNLTDYHWLEAVENFESFWQPWKKAQTP